MVDLGTAVTKKKDEDVKAAQQSLVKKAVTAVIVFLVATLVGVIFAILGRDEYKKVCMHCVNHPFDYTNCPKLDDE